MAFNWESFICRYERLFNESETKNNYANLITKKTVLILHVNILLFSDYFYRNNREKKRTKISVKLQKLRN